MNINEDRNMIAWPTLSAFKSSDSIFLIDPTFQFCTVNLIQSDKLIQYLLLFHDNVTILKQSGMFEIVLRRIENNTYHIHSYRNHRVMHDFCE
jgi:hypothetical protein